MTFIQSAKVSAAALFLASSLSACNSQEPETKLNEQPPGAAQGSSGTTSGGEQNPGSMASEPPTGAAADTGAVVTGVDREDRSPASAGAATASPTPKAKAH